MGKTKDGIEKRKRADGSIGYYTRARCADGTRPGKTFSTQREAKAWKRRMEARAEDERDGIVAKRRAGTLNSVYEEWLSDRPPERAHYNRMHLEKRILPFMGHMRLSEIDDTAIRKLIRHLETSKTNRGGEKNKEGRTLRPATVNNHIITLRKILNDHGYTRRIKYVVPKGDNEQGWLSDPEMVPKFLAACEAGDKHDQSGEWFMVAAALGIYAGMRKGEIAALRIDLVDFKRERIHVAFSYDKTTKGKRARYVPLAPELATILRKWIWQRGKVGGILRRPGKLVVVSPRGPITIKMDLARKARRACKRAGLPVSIPFHGGRHTAGSYWAERRSLAKVGAALGHMDPKTTQRYAHMNTEHIAQDEAMKLSFGANENAKVVPFNRKARK